MAHSTLGSGTIPPNKLNMDTSVEPPSSISLYLAVRPISAPTLTIQAAHSQPTYEKIWGIGAPASYIIIIIISIIIIIIIIITVITCRK